MNICIALGDNMENRHQHKPWLQYNYGPDMGLQEQQGSGHHHGLRRQHAPHTSTWLQMAAQIMDLWMAFSGNKGHRHQHVDHTLSHFILPFIPVPHNHEVTWLFFSTAQKHQGTPIKDLNITTCEPKMESFFCIHWFVSGSIHGDRKLGKYL